MSIRVRHQKAAHIVHKMQQHGKPCIACATLEELLALKPDYLVESASPAAMRELALPALKNGTSVITLSIGALADETFYREVAETAKANGTRIYIASGATGGFDVLRTASLMGNTTARFFNEKGPNALKGTPVYDDSLQTEQRTVFSGSAAEAISPLSNQSECYSCRLTSFCRSGEHAGIHTIYPRICGRYAKGRNQK